MVTPHYRLLLTGLILLVTTVELVHAETPDYRFNANIDAQSSLAKERIAFARQVYEATQRKDAEWISSRILYPVRTGHDRDSKVFKSNKSFMPYLAAKFKGGLFEAIYKEITHPEMFLNYQGVMLGDGVVWFDGDSLATMKISSFAHLIHQ